MHHRALPARLGRDFDLAQLVERGHGDFKIVVEVLRHLRPEDAAQHQDRRADAGVAQGDALFHEGDADLLHALPLQCAGHRHQPVAVAVGLDDAHHRHAHSRADRRMIVGKGIEIDIDASRTLVERVAHRAIRPRRGRTAYPSVAGSSIASGSPIRSRMRSAHTCGVCGLT